MICIEGIKVLEAVTVSVLSSFSSCIELLEESLSSSWVILAIEGSLSYDILYFFSGLKFEDLVIKLLASLTKI